VWKSLLARDGQWRRIEHEQPDLLQDEFQQVTAILSTEQQVRVRELIVQRKGLSAFLDDDLRRQIGLSGHQVERIRRSIQDHSRRVSARNQALESLLQAIALGREPTDVIAKRLHGARLEAGQSNRRSFADAWKEAWEVLSPRQRQAYEKLAGGPGRNAHILRRV
jgi:hypothetical protein